MVPESSSAVVRRLGAMTQYSALEERGRHSRPATVGGAGQEHFTCEEWYA